MPRTATPHQLPACAIAGGALHALGAEEIATAFNAIDREANHSYRTMVWWARRDMSFAYDQFHQHGFCEPNADRVDSVMEELERRLDGTFDTLPSFLPTELRQHGQPRRYLQNVEIP